MGNPKRGLLRNVLLGFSAALSISTSSGYELATHAALTKAAFERSQLENSSDFLIQRLGFLELLNLRQQLKPSKDIFGARFYEFDSVTVVERRANPGPPVKLFKGKLEGRRAAALHEKRR